MPRAAVLAAVFAALTLPAFAGPGGPPSRALEAHRDSLREATAPPPIPFEALPEVESVVACARSGGGLLLRSATSGAYRHAPTVHTTIDLVVTGLVARATVTQRFTNPSTDWVEGVYVFPLPENAAVDGLDMIVGQRRIEGIVQERQEARKTYEKAKKRGSRASLVEQERPNMFTTSVANVGPGDSLEIELAMQQEVRWESDHFSLRFPTVVGQRFIPGGAEETDDEALGWSPNTDVVPDAARITPWIRAAGDPRRNALDVSVSLDAGVPLAAITSPSHELDLRRKKGTRWQVGLTGDGVADRDLVLRWRPEVGEAPTAALLTQDIDGELYALLMLLPPRPDAVTSLRREVVFVIDRSGSMSGTSMPQAKRALALALERLHPEDSFNVIAFSNHHEALFATPRQAHPATVDAAVDWVQGLSAGGGTMAAPALVAAMEGDGGHGDVRQVVFLTDGAIGNEAQMFRLIEESLGRSRLFMVGIGSAPNGHLMRRSAEHGRGAAAFISDLAEVEERMGELFTKLERPVLGDIEVVWDDPAAEVWPRRVGDLYAGEPLMLSARLATLGRVVVARGRRGHEAWSARLEVDAATEEVGLGKLWARRKIRGLMSELARGGDREEIRHAVVDVALDHHLVSRWTSLVAVETTPVRPRDEGLARRGVPSELPAGWSRKHLPGVLPRSGTGAALWRLAGLVLLVTGWLVARWR